MSIVDESIIEDFVEDFVCDLEDQISDIKQERVIFEDDQRANVIAEIRACMAEEIVGFIEGKLWDYLSDYKIAERIAKGKI